MAVIFDCDGVLVDSEKIFIRVLGDTLQALVPNQDITPLLLDAAGRQTSHVVADVAASTNMVFPPDIVQVIDSRTHAVLDRELEPVPGVESMLASLIQEKAVVSNSTRSRVLKSLEDTGLDGFNWRAIFSAEDVTRPKPAPDLYLYAAAKLGVNPNECLVVEDSLAGVTAAVAAGTNVVGFVGASNVGPGQADRLFAAGALDIAENMSDLCVVLNRLGNGRICRGSG